MTHIVGIDLSLTCAGIARITRTGQLVTGVVESAGKRADRIPARHARITSVADRIALQLGSPDFAVIEGCTGSPGGSPLDRHHLWWLVVGALVRAEVPVAVIQPNTLKKAIGGHGRADKVVVAMAVSKLYPADVDQLTGNDTTDAAALAHLGAVHLGWDVPTLARHREAKFTEWPAELAPARSLPESAGAL